MLFTKVLLALPFIGAAFAAPTFGFKSSSSSSVSIGGKHSVDILAVVTDLKASVSTSCGGISLTSTQVEVEAALCAVISAFDTCQSSFDVGAGAGIGLGIGGGIGSDLKALLKGKLQIGANVKAEVAAVLAETIQLVDGLICNISEEIKVIPSVDGYLCQLSPLIKKLLCSVEKVCTGVIGLCGKALVKLGCVLTPLLSGVNGLLGGLLGNILG